MDIIQGWCREDLKRDYRISKKSIGNRLALENTKSGELQLFGKAGDIYKNSDTEYRVTIHLKTYKLATPQFTDMAESGPQVLFVSHLGISSMADHLKVPTDPKKQYDYI